MESNSLKINIKLKNENVAGSSGTDELNNGKVEPSSKDGQNPQVNLPPDHRDQAQNTSEDEPNNGDMDDEENQTQNSQNQLICYEPTANESSLSSRRNSFTNRTPKYYSSIGAFTVQCANCFKWRLIPTLEKYEEIREFIIDKPFVCEAGQEWKPGLSCNDPPDLTQDGSRLWAIDKPNIPRPPSGWKRLLRIRGEGGTKFADVYYAAPSGKRLRSLHEVQRFLNDHPEYVENGVNMSRFSFQIPRPLQENYVRKRAPGMPSGSFHPAKVLPLSWMPPDLDTAMRLGRTEVSYDYNDSRVSNVEHSKSRKPPLKRRSNGKLVHEQSAVDLENTFRL